MTANEKNKIYRLTVSALERQSLTKRELFSAVSEKFGLSSAEMSDTAPNTRAADVRSEISNILEMLQGRGLLTKEGEHLFLTESKPVVIRAAKCESEIISMLSDGPMDKREIRERLETAFGTKKTATQKDDNILFSYLGQILRRLINERTVVLRNGKYSISRSKSAKIGDMEETLDLQNDFLERLHAKGGEFFENYFLNLLSKYLAKHGKKVTECYVTGGSADGGIDGVVRTVDSLGFREIIMVQTKNRNIYASETEVRSFYGAVCAKMGSRGIFVTSSDFHSSAAEFLNSIDNCVGVNGAKIFGMASECLFGIKRRDGNLIIDSKLI